MPKRQPRICSTRFPEEIDCLIHMTQKQMALTQAEIKGAHISIARVEPDRFLDVGDCRLWLTQGPQRVAKLKIPRALLRSRAIAVSSCICDSANRF